MAGGVARVPAAEHFASQKSPYQRHFGRNRSIGFDGFIRSSTSRSLMPSLHSNAWKQGGLVRYLLAAPTLICLISLLAGCSSAPVAVTPAAPATPVTIPADWGYEKNAITLHVKADQRLNLFHKTPHTLMLCIYHLRDPNSFNELQEQRDGLQKLLECTRFDPSVVHTRSLVIQPGQEISESLDRPDGARFVNIAAGYYNMRKDGVTRSFPVSVSVEKRGETLVQTTQKMTVDLYLGPKEIQSLQNK
jgi:type VI secretion system VasD/TssJ family lipoprotein